MVKKIVKGHERKIQRLLEILPGFFSWNLILFPLWGSFFFPEVVAYLVLAFDVLWFYKSITAGAAAFSTHRRMKKHEKVDWLVRAKKLPGFSKTHHIVIIPTANEPTYILERTLTHLSRQTLDPKKYLTVVLAMEERIKGNRERAALLRERYKSLFAYLFFTLHPLAPGEVKGKSSNEAYAGKWVKKRLVDEYGLDRDYLTVTTADCDVVFHRQYFANLSYHFLKDPNRYRRFWQGAMVFYNNIWRIPAASRVVNTINTVWQMAQLSRKDRLINYSTYSTSLRMLEEVGFWDVDVIPEDYRIFFKCFFRFGGEVEVEPIFLPISADAAESTSTFKTLKNQYLQQQRWAWGVSDDPLFIKWWLTKSEVPFLERTVRVLKVLLDHFFWPVNWLMITLGASLPLLLNPRFAQTILGRQLPQISSFLLTLCLVSLLMMIYIDSRHRPASSTPHPLPRRLLVFGEWLLMPLTGFFLGALPGLDAHTRLMLGKYLEYRVTEKV